MRSSTGRLDLFVWIVDIIGLRSNVHVRIHRDVSFRGNMGWVAREEAPHADKCTRRPSRASRAGWRPRDRGADAEHREDEEGDRWHGQQAAGQRQSPARVRTSTFSTTRRSSMTRAGSRTTSGSTALPARATWSSSLPALKTVAGSCSACSSRR